MNNQQIHNQIQQLQQQIQQLQNQLQPETNPKPQTQTPNHTNWPPAAPPTLIATTQTQKQYRATQILGHILTKTKTPPHTLKNQTTLEIGTGEAHLAHQLTQHTHHTTAYDNTPHPQWTQQPTPKNLTLTTNPNQVHTNAPYDLIILHDTLDHTTNQTPQDLLNWLHQLTHPKTTIYIKTHPWTAKHGAHQYQHPQTNQAYIHLYLTPTQLHQHTTPHTTLPPNQKITHPQATYQQWLKQTNWTPTQQHITTQPPHPHITQPHIIQQITQNTWNNKITTQQATKILHTQYIEYIINPNT